MTFIDYNFKIVWNGSRLSKGLSANAFDDCWNKNINPEIREAFELQAKVSQSNNTQYVPIEKPHHLSDFLST